MASPRLFLDADGVLADFDEGARRLLGMTPATMNGSTAAAASGGGWRRRENFYGTLPEMPDARLLFDAVRHLSRRS